MSQLVLVEKLEPGVSLVTMNRPERRNALSLELLERLCATIRSLGQDDSQRVMMLRGTPPVFCAGLDLAEAADESRAERHAGAVRATLRLLKETPLITIAVVQGGAFAGGGAVMAACDIVVAAEDVQIGFPELRRGLLAALVSGVIQHRVGEGNLRELLLVGDSVDARRAREMGLVQRVVAADRLMDEATDIARSILAGAPQATRQTKRLINDMYGLSDAKEEERLLEAHLEARGSAEAREGLAAFAEKRKPNWS